MLPALGSNPTKYDAALVRQVLLKEVDQLSPAYAKNQMRLFYVPTQSIQLQRDSILFKQIGDYRVNVATPVLLIAKQNFTPRTE